MVHLEGWDEEASNEQAFNRHADAARRLAAMFEEHGAKATFETRPEFVEACRTWNDNVLLELYERGHGIGVHADVGGSVEAEGLTQKDFAPKIAEMKSEMEELTGIGVVHVSGICSTLDWVRAAADAGYGFTTGAVGYCAMSLPVRERPEEYRFCRNPGQCHGLMPLDLEDRINPWRTSSGLNWLQRDPDGRLVILPSDGVIKSLAEERSGDSSGQNEFTYEDIEAYLDTLEEALSLAKAGQVNILYVALSIGSPNLDKDLYGQWLSSVKPYVNSGRVEWKTLPEMYNAFLEWEESRSE